MTIVRIGNNIHVLWKIFDNKGTKYPLHDRVQYLFLKSAALETEIETYVIQNRNELTFMVGADDLTRYGTYKLVLKIRESESETQDACYDLTQVFQIVSASYPNAVNAIEGEAEVEFTSVLNNLVIEGGQGVLPENIAYIGDEMGEGGAIIPITVDFDAYTDTVWNKAQTLSAEQKAQILTNLGLESLIADGGTSTTTD